jgi:hypothetical protein
MMRYFLEPSLETIGALSSQENQRLLGWLPSYWFFGLFQKLNGSMEMAFAPLATHAWIGLSDSHDRRRRSLLAFVPAQHSEKLPSNQTYFPVLVECIGRRVSKVHYKGQSCRTFSVRLALGTGDWSPRCPAALGMILIDLSLLRLQKIPSRVRNLPCSLCCCGAPIYPVVMSHFLSGMPPASFLVPQPPNLNRI